MNIESSRIDPSAARQFAIDVLLHLREANFEAFWAGGCVRDQLMGNRPKDYDVATNATPKQVQKLFGKRTHAVGASFGVIVVVGKKEEGNVEVATFREDGDYLDGRHPDSVTFSSAELDAQRRDFTINGLFFDPVEQQVIDYVGGEADLNRQLIRAIGEASARIAEDKLRMLRAIRFAARFDFDIEQETREAIQQAARELSLISQERVTTEIRSILTHPNRLKGLGLIESLNLKDPLFGNWYQSQGELWETALELQNLIAEFNQPMYPANRAGHSAQEQSAPFDSDFPLRFAALLYPLQLSEKQIEEECRKWKLSNDDRKLITWLIGTIKTLLDADQLEWPKLQPTIAHPWFPVLLELGKAIALIEPKFQNSISFAEQKLMLSKEVLDPPALLKGQDLIEAGIRPGPDFKKLLDEIRAAQLNGEIETKEQAIAFAQQLPQ